MTALAQQVTAGLRAAPLRLSGEGAAMAEELRRRDAVIAERESALSERDARIAGLEAEKQDLLWRADADEERLREAADEARSLGVALEEARRQPAGTTPADVTAALRARDWALEEIRRAGALHLEESNRQRTALGEQAGLVAELEEALALADTRLSALEQEAGRWRRASAQAEEADRARRSRLAEVEGTLLRLRGQSDGKAGAALEVAQRRAADLERQVASLETQLGDAVRRHIEAETQARDTERDRDILRQRVGELESRVVGNGTAPSSVGDIASLHEALQRSEEQLWSAKGRLLEERERIAALERELGEVRSSKSAPAVESPPG
jgi:hypothetical protein